MKKIPIFFTALSLVFLISCNTKKQPGEEYYDPNYKPQTNQASTETQPNDNTVADAGQGQTAASGTTAGGTTAGGTTAGGTATGGTNTSGATASTSTTTDQATGAGPKVTTPQPSGAKIKGAPANKDEVTVAVEKKDKLKPSPAGQNVEKGKALIAKSDCLACHKDDAKLVGPAYVDVAAKYEDTPKNLDYLANKIIKGGAGAWGEIPMSPHPTLSQADAKEMARYILSLK